MESGALKLFNIIQIEKAFEIFAEEKVRLNNQGILIPDFDLLIGSTALSTNMKMVTNNEKHLKRLKGIQLENWTKHKFNEFIE